MDPRYRIVDTSRITTPALILYKELLEANLDHLIQVAGRADRLRPHCKTHKLPEVTKIELAKGIVKHKCATIAEAEMLAMAGAKDIFLAYNPVGPNIDRVVKLLQKYPQLEFKVTGDHPKPITELGAALSKAGLTVEVLLDLNVGQNRTGVEPGPQAVELYQLIAKTPGLKPGGLHVYDGHQQQMDLAEREAAIKAKWAGVQEFRAQLKERNLPVPRIVCGGTGSFPVYAKMTDPEIELSPGTLVFNDAGYSRMFPDLVFPPSTALLTRVVSKPTPDRITLDLGTKSVASDPPAGKRVVLLDLPDAEHVGHNEEHLIVKTDKASQFEPGDELYAFPVHVCPTTAWHQQVWVVSEGQLVDQWPVVGRDRVITV